MPLTFTSTFRPLSRTGAQLNDFVTSLFSGRETPNEATSRRYMDELRQANTRQADASARHSDSLAGKTNVETDILRARREMLFGDDVAPVIAALTGQSIPEVQGNLEIMRTEAEIPRQWPIGTDSVPAAVPAASAAGGPVAETRLVVAPRSDSYARTMNAMRARALAAMTGENNADRLMKAYTEGIDSAYREAVMAGKISPEEAGARMAAVGGKPLYNMNADGQVFGLFSGKPGASTPLVEANIKNIDATAEKGRYRMNAAGDVIDTSTGGATYSGRPSKPEDELVEIDVNGKKVQVYRKDLSRSAAAAAYRPPEKPPKPEKPEKLSATEMKNAQSMFSSGVDSIMEQNDGFAIDSKMRQQIMSRATQLFKDPNGDFFRDPAGAFDAAVTEIAPDGWEKQGDWNPFKDNVLVPKGRSAPPASSASPPASAGKQPARPKGKTDAQLIDEANAAIKRGADPKAVKERLRAYGVKTD